MENPKPILRSTNALSISSIDFETLHSTDLKIFYKVTIYVEKLVYCSICYRDLLIVIYHYLQSSKD